MNIGDHVYIKEKEYEYTIEVIEFTASSGVRGRILEGEGAGGIGLWWLTNIDEAKVVPKPFAPVDGTIVRFKNSGNTYVYSNGYWWVNSSVKTKALEDCIKKGSAEVVE